MEAGAETVETGGEVAERVGQGGEAIPVKDSIRWDPSLSTATENNVSFCYAAHSGMLISHSVRIDLGRTHLSLF